MSYADNMYMYVYVFHSIMYSWFHKNMDRGQAEEMLKRIPYNGAYIVRCSESDQSAFAISFR